MDSVFKIHISELGFYKQRNQNSNQNFFKIKVIVTYIKLFETIPNRVNRLFYPRFKPPFFQISKKFSLFKLPDFSKISTFPELIVENYLNPQFKD